MHKPLSDLTQDELLDLETKAILHRVVWNEQTISALFTEIHRLRALTSAPRRGTTYHPTMRHNDTLAETPIPT